MPGTTYYNQDTAFGLKGGIAVTAGELIGCSNTGAAVKADGDAGTPIRALGVAIIDRSAAEPKIGISDDCLVEYPGSNFTPGGRVYLSGVPGGITQVALSAAGNLRQVVGTAISSTCVRFRIFPIDFVVQAAGNSAVAFG
ncbi:hypothetical protein EON81_13445 [bacterium]|nr:MAG: hypothetical protein EON81_13445 [bacterium]